MPKFPELTEAQGEPLFKLVRCQKETQKEIQFLLSPGVPQVEGRVASRPIEICLMAEEKGVIATVCRDIVQLWSECDYVQLLEREGIWPTVGLVSQDTTLILRKRALDYAEHMSKHRIRRWATDVVYDWSTELRAGIVAVIVAVLSSIITSVVMQAVISKP